MPAPAPCAAGCTQDGRKTHNRYPPVRGCARRETRLRHCLDGLEAGMQRRVPAEHVARRYRIIEDLYP